MQVIQAPVYSEVEYHALTLFLGGGISNCADWQTEFIKKLGVAPVTVFNPRREDFDISDPQQSEIQIDWEHHYLVKSSLLLFWFPAETLCPITLFELGAALERHKGEILIGCHPDYKRLFDVKYQTALVRPEIEIVTSLDALAKIALDKIARNV